jgi:hypothetical protein
MHPPGLSSQEKCTFEIAKGRGKLYGVNNLVLAVLPGVSIESMHVVLWQTAPPMQTSSKAGPWGKVIPKIIQMHFLLLSIFWKNTF